MIVLANNFAQSALLLRVAAGFLSSRPYRNLVQRDAIMLPERSEHTADRWQITQWEYDLRAVSRSMNSLPGFDHVQFRDAAGDLDFIRRISRG